MNKSTNKLEVEAVDADEMQRTLPDGNTVYVIRTERGQNVLSLKLEAGDEAEEVVEIQDDLQEETVELEEEEVVEEEVGTVKPFPCDMCDRRFVCRDERNRHIEEHFKSIECPVCHKFIQGDRAYQYHTSYGKCSDMVEAKRIFKCDICNQKVFDSPEALQQHHNENHNVIIDRSTVLCEICNTKFAHIKYLKKHISEIHTKATQYVCDTCGKKFNRKSNLKEHLLIHTDLRLSKCDVCEKSYRTPSALKLHYRMHTGEKPYVCNMCHVKAYSYNTDLKRHKRTVHGVLGKQFDCQICSKIFYEPKLLRYHMRKCHE